MNQLFSLYPLSAEQKERLGNQLGSLTYYSISEISKKSILDILKTLWYQSYAHTYLYIVSEEQQRFLPNLLWFGLLSRSKNLYLISPQYNVQSLSRLHYFFKLPLSFLHASLKGCNALLKTAWRSRQTSHAAQDQASNASVSLPPFIRGQHIIYLNANFWFGLKAGGAIAHATGIIEQLLERGYIVDAIGFTKLDIQHPALNLIHPKFPSLFGLPLESNYYRFSELLFEELLPQYLNAPPAFIYQRLSFGNDTGIRLGQALNCPVILEYNGSEVWVNQQWGRPIHFPKLAQQVELHTLKQAHTVLTVSEVLRQELIQRGVPQEHIIMHPNGVDPKRFNPQRYSVEEIQKIRAAWNIPPHAVILSFVGTFGIWHGVSVLAQAIEQMVQKHRPWLEKHAIVFLLIGDGQLGPQIRQQLSHPEIAPFVRFTGLVDPNQIPLYLATSDILLSPHIPNADQSAFFGSPTKIFEYMAMGKPIIASDLEQVGEVLRPHREVSILCAPGNPQALMDAIIDLVEHPALWGQLGNNARKKVLEHYTWRAHVDALWKRLYS